MEAIDAETLPRRVSIQNPAVRLDYAKRVLPAAPSDSAAQAGIVSAGFFENQADSVLAVGGGS